MCLGRYSDLCRLRFDHGYYEDHTDFLRFFIDKRKTDQSFNGQWIDIASSLEAANGFDGFSAVVELRKAAAALGNLGPVLRRIYGPARRERLGHPFITSGKHAGCPANMTRDTFQRRYQQLLVKFCGLSQKDTEDYTSQGLRAGGTTTLLKHRVPKRDIQRRAGTTSEGWLGMYDRVDLDRRLQCSRALGL